MDGQTVQCSTRLVIEIELLDILSENKVSLSMEEVEQYLHILSLSGIGGLWCLLTRISGW